MHIIHGVFIILSAFWGLISQCESCGKSPKMAKCIRTCLFDISAPGRETEKIHKFLASRHRHFMGRIPYGRVLIKISPLVWEFVNWWVKCDGRAVKVDDERGKNHIINYNMKDWNAINILAGTVSLLDGRSNQLKFLQQHAPERLTSSSRGQWFPTSATSWNWLGALWHITPIYGIRAFVFFFDLWLGNVTWGIGNQSEEVINIPPLDFRLKKRFTEWRNKPSTFSSFIANIQSWLEIVFLDF